MSIDLVNAIALLLFVGAVLVGFISTVVRIVNLWRGGVELPILIWRDAQVIGGLALSFLVISVHRVIGAPFAENVWYSIVTAAPAVYGVLAYCYYEIAVVGHRRDR